MRRGLFALLAAAVLVSAPSAMAEKAKTARAKPVAAKAAVAPDWIAMSARSDAELVVRASHVRDLPRTLSAADKGVLGHAAGALRSGRVDVARAALSRWVATTRVSNDDAIVAVLWVTRESVVGGRADLITAAERVRDVDERVLSLESALAELHVAATQRSGGLVNLPVAFDPANDVAASEKRVQRVGREDIADRLAQTERSLAQAMTERAAARDAFSAVEAPNRVAFAAIVRCLRAASERTRV